MRPSHVIFLLDCSNSMLDQFPLKGLESQTEAVATSTKIEQAKVEIFEWFLNLWAPNRITIIPSHFVPGSFSSVFQHSLPALKRFLDSLKANNSPVAKDAVEVALKYSPDDNGFTRYLIVLTTGSSSHSFETALTVASAAYRFTILMDIESRQGIQITESSAVFTAHNGVHFRLVLDQILGRINRDIAEIVESAPEIDKEFGSSVLIQRQVSPPPKTPLPSEFSQMFGRIRRQPDADILSPSKPIATENSNLSERTFKASLTRPKRLSKGYSSYFLVQIFLPSASAETKRKIGELFSGIEIKTTAVKTAVLAGRTIEIKLQSAEIDFSEAVKKKIERDAVHVILVGKPKESSRPGEHPGVLSIRDAKNGSEYVSVPFKVEIVDYAFDHISRPMLARGAAVLAGIGGVLSFALTIFEQVDKGFGLASGTAGGFIALLLFRWTVGVYQKPSVSAGGDI